MRERRGGEGGEKGTVESRDLKLEYKEKQEKSEIKMKAPRGQTIRSIKEALAKALWGEDAGFCCQAGLCGRRTPLFGQGFFFLNSC